MPAEIRAAQPGDAAVASFWETTSREALATQWNFRVIWHEQVHDLLALDTEGIVGALHLRIAASLAHVEALTVLEPYRRRGIGRDLVTRSEEVANYYNCHKVSVAVHARSGAHAFFEACGYKDEAVLAQHTFKLDVAIMRKFLL